MVSGVEFQGLQKFPGHQRTVNLYSLRDKCMLAKIRNPLCLSSENRNVVKILRLIELLELEIHSLCLSDI